ncbi:Peroxisome biosynthesis protein PAS1 [Cyphellophora attinorum]|uniref:Peroxisomal ATPase PEX1 n=1 Tax=Cyphellophora attinorum TaxID=1664694 RepID=A0A0N1HBP1_9EURO|nr:Peroxisome biosynthesis protein PAS1 [Phialophora attinorum]KPI45650.1 Peroxisome biosynthesis protein PAS1 [Phialophora attinorum]
MAPSARAEVAFVSLQNCLVNLPPNLIALIDASNIPAQNVIIEIQYQTPTLSATAVSSGGTGFQRSVYVGWTGYASRTRPASVINADRRGTRELEVPMVEIDSIFGAKVGLSEARKVGLLVHLDPPLAHTINIEPLTPADWEIIELHANFLELNLLSQIRALPNPSFSAKGVPSSEANHPLTLHLSPTHTANIKVTTIVPPQPSSIAFTKIAPDAEVIVAPKTRASSVRNPREQARSVTSRRSGKSGASTTQSANGRRSSNFKTALFLRAVDRHVGSAFFPAEDQDVNTGLKLWLPQEHFASEAMKGAKYASITIVKPNGLRADLEKSQLERLKEEEASDVGRPATRLVAEVHLWSNPVDTHHAGLSSTLSSLLGVKSAVGNIIRIEPAFRPLHHSSVQALTLFPFALEGAQKREELRFGGDSKAAKAATLDKLRIAQDGPHGLLSGPITDGMILPASGEPSSLTYFPGGILRIQQKGQPESDQANALVWAIGQEQKDISDVRSEVPRPIELTALFPSFAQNIPEKNTPLIGVDNVIKQSMANLTLCSSVLLTGAIGSGKTSISYNLARQLREDFLFNVTYFSCAQLVTDETRVSAIRETLKRLFMSASWCARLGGQALVVLDDLDKICPAETEMQTLSNDNERSRQTSEVLCGLIRQYCTFQSGVTLLATAQSKDSVHSLFISGHVVGEIVNIKAPTKEIRRDVLYRLTADEARQSNGNHAGHSRNTSNSQSMSEHSWMDPSMPSSRPGSAGSSDRDGFRISPQLDLLDVAGKTDGYMPADLVLLVSRARDACLTRSILADPENSSSELTLTRSDFDAALKNFTPTSLRNVTLTTSSTTFASIGGLHATRKTLLETLMYPTKYAPIFAKSPLRLRSGLLLYGYPGCGKTLLASAVAGECNLNFISVKGPEILNKYIGASEKSVRDLFERAQAAKPCVLFFDEFDSIAPKRGHDSTGVTDRVVNQMLTQMDGAEGLDGVYVLAATSRPDLIDPALLRPGRLDKSLLCDMPTMEDRLDILQAVSKTLHLKADVENRLLTIAERTEGFTGADLQALVYNAHLEAIHDLLGDKSSSSHQSKANGTLPNGTSSSSTRKSASARKGSRDSNSSKIPEFTQFLFDPAADADARNGVVSSSSSAAKKSLLETNAAIASKLEELKLLRKRERAAARGDFSFFSSQAQSQGGDEDGVDKGEAKVMIEWKHIERSLKTTRSSISRDEIGRLRVIYREFVVGRKGDMPGGEPSMEIGGRSTLM